MVLSPCEYGLTMVLAEGKIINSGCGGAVLVNFRLQLFWAFQGTMTELQRPVVCRIIADAPCIGIKPGIVEVPALLVRLPPVEGGELCFPVAPHITRRCHAKRNMRRIQPVMA